MNCGKCNTPLIPGNPVCPNCGAVNDLSSVANSETEELVDLEEESEVKQVDANIAPPTLEVNSEDLTQNVKDLGSSDTSSTYDPEYENQLEAEKKEEIHEDLDGDGNPEYSSNDSVNIAIPSVSKPVEVEALPEGEAPSIDANAPTLGAPEKEDVKTFKIGGKTIKLKMGKKRNVPQVILIGGIVIFFIIGVMVGSTVFKQNVCISGRPNLTNTDDVHFVADGKNNTTKAGSFTYKIPEDYIFDKTDNGVLIYDKGGTWRIFIKDADGSYDNMASAKVSIEESIKTEGINVVSIKESKINDTNHLLIEASKNLINRLIAFIDAGNDHVFYIEIVNLDNNFNYELLNIADDIAKNAVFDQKTNYIENMPVNDITDISVTAAEAHKSLNTKDKAVDNE